MESFKRNSIWQLLQSVSSTGTDLLVLLAFSAKLSATEFGQLTVLLSFAKIVSLLCEPRIHEYLIPRLVKVASRTRQGVWVYVRIGLTVELGGNLLALFACTMLYLLAPEMLNAQAGDSALFPFTVLFVTTSTLLKYSSISIFRAFGLVKKSALIAMTTGVVKLVVLGVALFWMDCGSMTALLLLSAIGLGTASLQTTIAFSILRSRCGEQPVKWGNRLRLANVSRSVRQVFANYAMGLLEIANRELDIQLLAGLSNATEAGRYRIAKNLAMIIMELLNPIVLMLLPEFSSRVASRKWNDVRQFAKYAARLLSVIAVGSGLLMYFIVPFMVARFLPSQFESIPVFEIMLIGLIASTPLIWAQSLLVAAGRSYQYLVASAVGATAMLSAGILLVPLLGAAGAALGYCISLFITSALAAWAAVVIVRRSNL